MTDISLDMFSSDLSTVYTDRFSYGEWQEVLETIPKENYKKIARQLEILNRAKNKIDELIRN